MLKLLILFCFCQTFNQHTSPYDTRSLSPNLQYNSVRQDSFGGYRYYLNGRYQGYSQRNNLGGMRYYNNKGYIGNSQANSFGGYNYSQSSKK